MKGQPKCGGHSRLQAETLSCKRALTAGLKAQPTEMRPAWEIGPVHPSHTNQEFAGLLCSGFSHLESPSAHSLDNWDWDVVQEMRLEIGKTCLNVAGGALTPGRSCLHARISSTVAWVRVELWATKGTELPSGWTVLPSVCVSSFVRLCIFCGERHFMPVNCKETPHPFIVSQWYLSVHHVAILGNFTSVSLHLWWPT